MASSHLSTVLVELPDREVTVQDGRQLSDHEGSVTVSRSRADGAVTLELAADRAQAREQSMSVSLSAEGAASLEDALAQARAED